MKNISIIIYLLFLVNPVMSNVDKPGIIRLADLFIMIRSNHPVARQINLLTDRAKANLRIAKGGFDPKLYSSYDDKFFDEKNYWRVFEGGLKVSTSLPVEITAGFSWNDGGFLNPEQTLPPQGQAVIGAKISLGKGLLIDQRRASLRQAQIFSQLAETEQIRMLNDLFLDAALSYWEWAENYARLQILERSVSTAKQRFEAVRATFFAGDYAGIDTTEALTQLQAFQLQLNEATIKFRNSAYHLSNFLWDDQGFPLEVTDRLIPEPIQEITLPPLLSQDSLRKIIERIDLHPELQKLSFKRSELALTERLKIEQMKPEVDLKYNFLSTGLNFTGQPGDQEGWPWTQNYKWGISISYPLFLRKERGELEMTRIKIQENMLQQQEKRQSVTNKILSYATEIEILLNQANLITQAVDNYNQLLNGEEIKFAEGESNLFLVNSREIKLLEARIKLLSVKSKILKAESMFLWASGNLAN